MKIVSWNCGGKFREKFQAILDVDADIYVIQECENPVESRCIAYREFAHNYLWIGENKNKGLGVFAKNGIRLTENNWNKYCLRNFLSVRIDDVFDLVAVWACKPYIEEYYIYQSINISNYTKKTVIIGDFNSNAIWDKKHDTRTHSSVVRQLNEVGLISAYHHMSGEKQGEETIPTFYLYRHTNKGYHIDHCFTGESNIKDFQILPKSDWLTKSDHIPILIEIQSE
ncbi:MAG: endonuclease/exonuclease/phosphatase family protein [Oscillospiraceae bacterium]|nr:endonuclease/exonuclease/phosphatase family protein [Oscillospiraceae bacterium]